MFSGNERSEAVFHRTHLGSGVNLNGPSARVSLPSVARRFNRKHPLEKISETIKISFLFRYQLRTEVYLETTESVLAG